MMNPMTAMKKLREERGQAIILFVGLFTVIMVIGAISVDFGLWVSERRGAQKDGDAVSLAGVQAYLADLSDTSGAFDDGVRWAVNNGVDQAKIDGAPTSNCSAGNSCVNAGTEDCYEGSPPEGVPVPDHMPWVEGKIRHNSRALFSSIFGLAAPDIGAVARACVGSPRSATDLSPFGVPTDFIDGEPISDCMELDPDHPGRTRPVYGAVCILKTSSGSCQPSQSGEREQAGARAPTRRPPTRTPVPTSTLAPTNTPGPTNTPAPTPTPGQPPCGQNGQLTIGDLDCDQRSASTLRHDFHYGTRALCTVDQEVNSGTGNIIGLLQGLNDRLLEEGRCDDLFFTGNPGYDDFDEVFSIVGDNPNDPLILPSNDNVFAENDCRITSTDSDGNTYHYVPRLLDIVLVDHFEQGEQTTTVVGFAGFYAIGCIDDDDAEATRDAIEANLADMGAYLNRCDRPTGGDDILGIFVETLAPPLNVGDPDNRLPLSIVLVK